MRVSGAACLRDREFSDCALCRFRRGTDNGEQPVRKRALIGRHPSDLFDRVGRPQRREVRRFRLRKPFSRVADAQLYTVVLDVDRFAANCTPKPRDALRLDPDHRDHFVAFRCAFGFEVFGSVYGMEESGLAQRISLTP